MICCRIPNIEQRLVLLEEVRDWVKFRWNLSAEKVDIRKDNCACFAPVGVADSIPGNRSGFFFWGHPPDGYVEIPLKDFVTTIKVLSL
jgi:hypothetical protein